ncbi:MAG: hypothetical protein A2Y10_12160 [Planctomycetes bacterium GWF2_41_51]|nr:MAG: hypothetical protein A2Y10_12160 [Planctomycetes bacterium GWF2_41_51]HBG28700.1 hypothetical protein [Phycisphaerales bacterium]
MKVGKLCAVICGVCAVMIIFAGCVPSSEMKLNLSPKSETTYKVVTGSTKDYEFVQPSINKTKERHTGGSVEMVFSQSIESVDEQGNAIANITIKQLKYTSADSQGKEVGFDSTTANESDPMTKLIGASYKIKISPKGAVEVVDASAARALVKQGASEKTAARMLSDEEIARRHQVMALFDAKDSYKKGEKWSSVTASPAGMLRSKSFEKVYTLTDIKEENDQKIATIEMNAVPSSKRVEGASDKEAGMGMFANMFDEKDEYTGKMIINLTTGTILSYDETLKAQWVAAETSEEQKSDKGPDQLTMGFTYNYSIEKVD